MDKKWMILIGFFSAFTLISSIVSTSIIFMNDETRTEVNSNKVLPNKNIYKSTSIVYDESNNLNFFSKTSFNSLFAILIIFSIKSYIFNIFFFYIIYY